MRIALRDLETARADPAAFAQQLADGGGDGPRTRGYFMYWRDAVLRWTKGGVSATAAREDLDTALHLRFTNDQKIAQTLAHFDGYIAHYESLGYKNQRVRMSIRVPLPAGASSQYQVSGEVSSFERTSDYRYVASMLASSVGDWDAELRMPLIQYSVARGLNFETDDVYVGVYCYQDDSYVELTYSGAEIDDALSELVVILSDMEAAV